MRIPMASPPSLMGSLSSILLLSLLTSHTYAQLSNLPDLSTATQASNAASTAQSTVSSDASKASAAAATTAQPSSSDPTADSSSASVPQTTVTAAPALSTTTTTPSQSVFHLTDVPTLAGVGIPTQVIPYTAGAPFMQKSSLPEGTVFICVGAILGALGGGILAWRALVAWSLHRSVRRAALAYNFPTAETKLRPSGADAHARGLYAAAPAALGSTMSLDRLSTKPHPYSRPTSHVDPTGAAGGGGGGKKGGPTNPSATSLFFSPTASPSTHHLPPAHSGSSSPRDRGSAYLPAGYYASSAAAPAGGAGVTHLGADSRRNSMGYANRLSGLSSLGGGGGGGGGPQAAGYARTRSFGPTPPGSPGLFGGPSGGSSGGFGWDGSTVGGGWARSSVVGNVGGGGGGGGGLYSQPSSSSVTLAAAGGGRASNAGSAMAAAAAAGLNVPGGTNVAGGRAPSAYLEDLFEHHGNGMREGF